MEIKRETALMKAKKVIEDFKIDNIISNTFKVLSPQEIKEQDYEQYSFEFWKVIVLVPDEQWIGANSPFSIYLKDENMEPFMFHDGGAEGRTPDLEIIKKNGKYVIGDIWKDE